MKNAKKEITGMIKVTCPKCNTPFGLDTRFVEKVGDANFKYTCPYCKLKKAFADS